MLRNRGTQGSEVGQAGLTPSPPRLCEFRQSSQCPGRHPGHERFPDRHEAPQSPAEAAEGCQPALLRVPRSGDTTGRGTSPPLPTTGPSPLCTSALGLDWALEQKLLHGPGGTGHRPAPTTRLSQRACLLPGALLAFVREQGTGSKAPGCLPSVPSFRTCLPPPAAWSTRAASGGQRGSPPPPTPSSQPLPRFRGFSEAGSHAPCHPQLEVGCPEPRAPSPKTHCLPQGPPPRRVWGSPEGCLPPVSHRDPLPSTRKRPPPNP